VFELMGDWPIKLFGDDGQLELGMGERNLYPHDLCPTFGKGGQYRGLKKYGPLQLKTPRN
jgi:hypothetical protein